jgi:hypothetical protein
VQLRWSKAVIYPAVVHRMKSRGLKVRFCFFFPLSILERVRFGIFKFNTALICFAVICDLISKT